MLDARQITVDYGQTRILHAVDFTAWPGRVVAIVGPNGSGKTTLMRALTGEADYGGRVTLNGHDIVAAKPWDLAAIRGFCHRRRPWPFPSPWSRSCGWG